ncbi:MAG: CRISPR-associated endoribonuclease Cas6 [Thermoprotei archaeon]|nr:MAG: CRISPR-associated endoribonuclease Cas6 [Thermoprotei archaeon]
MIHVLELELRFFTSSVIEYFTGLFTLKLLLKLIALRDHDLARKLHNMKRVKPYSCTALMLGNKVLSNRVTKLLPNITYRVRYVLVLDEVFRTLITSISTHIGEKLTVENVDLTITNVRYTAISHIDLPSRPSPKITIEFLTPTRFVVKRTVKKRKPKYRLFPLPETIVHNILHHWNEYAPPDVKLDEKPVLEWVLNNVYETQYHLKRATSTLTRGRLLIGFVGWCTYTVEDLESHWSRIFMRLLRYGELVNVGNSKSMGLGMVRILTTES